MIDLIIDTEIMDKRVGEQGEPDVSTSAGQKEIEMRRIQKEREDAGLPPD